MTDNHCRTRAVLAYIVEYRANNGYSPTMAEIAAGVGLASGSGAAWHVRKLEQAGRLTRTFNTPRGVRMK